MSLTPWPIPESQPPLVSDEVQLWRVPLDPGPEAIARLAATLSPDERDRAARYHFERDRAAFIAARGALRAILGAACGLPAEAVVLTADEHGKPRLADGGPCFNLTHAGAWAIVALHPDRPLGVDLEPLRPIPDLACMLPMVFGPAERALLDAVPAHDRLDTFFAAWTRKEAVVKALGEGLGYGVERVGVAWAPGERVGPIALDGLPSLEWTLADLSFPGHRAALVIRSPMPALRRFTFVP